MEQRIREQIAHLQKESRVLRNLAWGILLYSVVSTYFMQLQFLAPVGFLFALFPYSCARSIYKAASALQPEQWSSPEQLLQVCNQVREESVWKLHTRLALLFTFYAVDFISYPTVELVVSIGMTLAFCALFEWGLRQFEKRTSV